MNETVNATEGSLEICGLLPNIVYNTSIVAENAVGSSSPAELVIFIEARGKHMCVYVCVCVCMCVCVCCVLCRTLQPSFDKN